MEKKDSYKGVPKVVKVMAENEQAISRNSSPIKGLQDFKNINNSLMQDALNVWAELWAELDSSRRNPPEPDVQAESDNIARPETDDGFEPSCGWPKFLEKMWVLWYYLDFAKRISQQ